MDHAAVDLDLCRAVEYITQHARRKRRARPRPAGERDARTALPDAHPRMLSIPHMDELRIDSARECGMVLKLRSQLRERKALGIVHKDHAVRISH